MPLLLVFPIVVLFQIVVVVMVEIVVRQVARTAGVAPSRGRRALSSTLTAEVPIPPIDHELDLTEKLSDYEAVLAVQERNAWALT